MSRNVMLKRLAKAQAQPTRSTENRQAWRTWRTLFKLKQ